MGEFFQNLSRVLVRLDLLNNPYFQFFIVIVIALIASKILERTVAAKKDETFKENHVFRELVGGYLTRNLLIIWFLIGMLFAFDLLQLDFRWMNSIQSIIITTILAICFFLAKKLIKSISITLSTSKSTATKRLFQNINIINLFKRFLEVTMFILFATLILGSWGIQVAPILAGLGIAGIAVGLALQDTLGHIFGGVSLILDNTYNEGDVVELENGNIGTIYSIGYRSSKILTPSNEIIIVPNGQLAKMMVKNLSRPSRLYRLNLVINVAYGSDPAHVKKVILNTAKDTEGVLDDPEALVFFEKMDSYSLNFRLIVSIQTPLERLVVTDKILTRLTDMFKKEKIQVPFPTTTVHIEK